MASRKYKIVGTLLSTGAIGFCSGASTGALASVPIEAQANVPQEGIADALSQYRSAVTNAIADSKSEAVRIEIADSFTSFSSHSSYQGGGGN